MPQTTNQGIASEASGANDLDFLSGKIPPEVLQSAIASGLTQRLAPHQILFAEGYITPQQYTDALAGFLSIRSVPLPDFTGADSVLIDATSPAAADVRAAVAAARNLDRTPVLFVGATYRHIEPWENMAQASVSLAIDALRTATPVASAGRRMWLWQYLVFALALGLTAGLAITAPVSAGHAALYISAAVFVVVAAFRVLFLLAALLPGRRVWARGNKLLADADLPTYCMLVPLFRETDILPDLIVALGNIDYPTAKLDIALILEESDKATRNAAATIDLPAHMRVVVVPDRPPRTKPKALNTALEMTRGEFITVFDAEDIPAPDQLRKAASVFAAQPGRYACLQARLHIYNPRQSWLTRQFALEYATLFHAMLPSLAALGLPIPLSGTSNHFPRNVLENAHWDPFNVTEDADLGIRLARGEGEIGLIDSDTLEEAPANFRQWLPQRTRWFKGWLQTYLVHTREPWRLLRELGLWRAAGFHAVFGGYLASALAYPWVVIGVALELHRPAPFATEAGSLHHLALVTAIMAFVTGVSAALLMAMTGCRRADVGRLGWNICAMPLYWMLISAAAYRAVVQFIWRPHLWEKTPHAARRGRTNKHPNHATS